MVTVRDAGPEDLGAVIQLVRRLGGDAALSEGLVRRFLAFSDTEILVAEGEGRVLGVLCYSYRPDLYHAGDNCFIEELCVAEQARGCGVGRELMEEVLRRARARRYSASLIAKPRELSFLVPYHGETMFHFAE